MNLAEDRRTSEGSSLGPYFQELCWLNGTPLQRVPALALSPTLFPGRFRFANAHSKLTDDLEDILFLWFDQNRCFCFV